MGIKKLLFFILVALSPFSIFSKENASKVDVAFVFYDAGETLALNPLIKQLEAKHIKATAVVMGTARGVLANCHHCLDIQKDCGTKAFVDQYNWPREKEMEVSDIEKIKSCIQPRLLVVGTVSEVQWQIAKAFKTQDIDVISYYDGLSPVEPKSVSEKFLATSAFWVPTHSLEEQVKKIAPHARVFAVGQPTLEKWRIAGLKEDPKAISSQIPGLEKEKEIILFAGGYGDGYEKSFKTFLDAASEMPEYQYLISLHPKVDGYLEKRLLAKYPSVHAIFVPKTLGTMKAAIISHAVVSQNSTVGVQALFMNKPTIYLDMPGSSFTNFAIQNKWASQTFSKDKFKEILRGTLASNQQNHFDIYQIAHLPMQSEKIMIEALIEALQKTKASN